MKFNTKYKIYFKSSIENVSLYIISPNKNDISPNKNDNTYSLESKIGNLIDYYFIYNNNNNNNKYNILDDVISGELFSYQFS